MKIGSFKLSGMDWSIEIDNEFCSQSSMAFNSSQQIIRIADNYDGVKLWHSNMERRIWDGIITGIIVENMQYRKLNQEDFLMPYTSFLFQALKSLTSVPGQWDGSFQVGGTEYAVITEDGKCSKEGCYGSCNAGAGVVYISTGDDSYSDSFILQTLFHEIAHAVAFEMGLFDSKINSEKFVNTLSNFVYEVWSTIKIDFPDERD